MNEAARQYLSNQAALEVATDAVLLGHYKTIADNDIRDVRYLKAKHLGGAWEQHLQQVEEAEMAGDIIVCEDYRRNDQQPTAPAQADDSCWLKVLVFLLLFAVSILIGALVYHLATKPKNGGPTTIEHHEGFFLELVPNKNGNGAK